MTDSSPRFPESSPQERFLHPLWFFFVTWRLPAASRAPRNSWDDSLIPNTCGSTRILMYQSTFSHRKGIEARAECRGIVPGFRGEFR